jgi:tryptophan-rich sensory protein
MRIVPSLNDPKQPRIQHPASVNGKEQRSIGAKSEASDVSSVGDVTATITTLDTGAVGRYGIALIIQMGLIAGVFKLLDITVASFNVSNVPFAINFISFYFLALKSRIFNPLSNQRPQPRTKEIRSKDDKQNTPQRNMPTWTPPGFVFPIVWLLIIGPIRAVSSSMVYSVTHQYSCIPLLCLMLHLSIGDIWNTINNIERRYGTSVIGVGLVWLSAAFAAYQYSLVNPLAGKLLSLPLVWLSIASSLIIRTWQLNPSPTTGQPEPLLPTKNKDDDGTITKLVWFENKNKNDEKKEVPMTSAKR